MEAIEGPVTIRFYDKHYSVLCPRGHLLTGGDFRHWAWSMREAKITAHQHAQRTDSQHGLWVAECDGTTCRTIK